MADINIKLGPRKKLMRIINKITIIENNSNENDTTDSENIIIPPEKLNYDNTNFSSENEITPQMAINNDNLDDNVNRSSEKTIVPHTATSQNGNQLLVLSSQQQQLIHNQLASTNNEEDVIVTANTVTQMESDTTKMHKNYPIVSLKPFMYSTNCLYIF